MEITTKEEKDIIIKYLSGKEYCERNTNICFKSSYSALLIHARELTGRCILTGKVEKEGRVGNWSGASMYLIMIDHIGGRFSRKGLNLTSKDFEKCLEIFSDLTKDEISILYQLRCAFLHKFNLFDIPKNLIRNKKRIFSVNRNSDYLIYEDVKNIDGFIKTNVSLKKLGDLVENIHNTLNEILLKDNLVFHCIEGFNLEKSVNINSIQYKKDNYDWNI